ncbi:MAG: Orange carotenoid protein [Pegethrix bostrychoides GSE-TBD4-15B]|jgi:hypothetical protein|uniref:Orange carotenoid protein n=1 Tax=Pegethrix bostrychoides GSE-TBD4-15B TaxID=2839662 RepID=A0A951P7T0_9CYAN|nr:Orange carotenoid protein [Pegethrix bostrychoides GSE-TBD4-15B]
MTYTTSNSSAELLSAFQALDVDQQLALFYFIYREMGDTVTPAAPAASTVSPEIAEGLFNQVKELSQEEQLQLQRDLINRQNKPLTRQYGALSDTTKLLFWYNLAQGMDNGTIIPMPNDYQLSDSAKTVLNQTKGLDFDEQITLFRNLVSPMGVDPTSAAQDPNTGL